MYTCTQASTHVNAPVHTLTQTFTHIRSHIRTLTNACIHKSHATHSHMCIQTHRHIHSLIHPYTCTHMHDTCTQAHSHVHVSPKPNSSCKLPVLTKEQEILGSRGSLFRCLTQLDRSPGFAKANASRLSGPQSCTKSLALEPLSPNSKGA